MYADSGPWLETMVHCIHHQKRYNKNINRSYLIPGDQILEWNGIDLSDKTYEEVQAIICQPNGEIELVVRP